MNTVPEYGQGLHVLGEDCYAWLEPPGSWGLANSGVVAGRDDVLVVDTQNDMPMARALLAAVRQIGGAHPVSTVINTHADGDHWNGNLMFDGARVLASAATLAEMKNMWLDPARLAELADQDSAFGRFIAWRTSRFDYDGWRPSYPTETFEGEVTLEAAGRRVQLVQVGPAHTRGDTLVHVPSAGVVFAGDILFTESTPIVWAGPLARSIDACDRILAMDPRLVVPGHGPVVDAGGVRLVREYFAFLSRSARPGACSTPPPPSR